MKTSGSDIILELRKRELHVVFDPIHLLQALQASFVWHNSYRISKGAANG
jgi:hypothetical protein